jgi:Flp pilus assembly protein TadD
LAAAMLRVDRALLVSPGDPILLATRSRLLLDRAQVTGSSSDLGLALVALSELTASDRNNAGHRLSLGLALVLAGDLEGAEREWLISQDLAPGSPVPSINLTRLYLEQGRLAEAGRYQSTPRLRAWSIWRPCLTLPASKSHYREPNGRLRRVMR